MGSSGKFGARRPSHEGSRPGATSSKHQRHLFGNPGRTRPFQRIESSERGQGSGRRCVMAANAELRVRCPSCGSKYKLPAGAVGRKVRCVKCATAFRVTDPRGDSHRSPSPSPASSPPPRSPDPVSEQPPAAHGKRPPSEEDILRWLSEADDEADLERRVELSDSTASVAGSIPPAATPRKPTLATDRMRGTAEPDGGEDLLAMRRVG